MDLEYIRAVEAAFSSAPFRLEFREYPQPASKPGVWLVMHQSNSVIIAAGDTPAGAVNNLLRMATAMSTIRGGLPMRGRQGV